MLTEQNKCDALWRGGRQSNAYRPEVDVMVILKYYIIT
jgi:hypothetical protein